MERAPLSAVRLSSVAVVLSLLLLVCTPTDAQCSSLSSGQTITAVNSSLNLTCSTVLWTGVTLFRGLGQSQFYVLFNLSRMMEDNPSGRVINITIRDCRIIDGVVLLFDSSGSFAIRRSVSITISNLQGRNSGLTFVGTFSANTTILIVDSKLTSNVSATMQSEIEALNPSISKMLMLLNFSLLYGSSFAVARSTVETNTSIDCFGLYVSGKMFVYNNSRLAIEDSFFNTTRGSAMAFEQVSVTINFSSSIQLLRSQLFTQSASPTIYFVKSNISLTMQSSMLFDQIGCLSDRNRSMMLVLSTVFLSDESRWAMSRSHFNISSASTQDGALVIDSASITLASLSLWDISSCFFAGQLLNAFLVKKSLLKFSNQSQWVVEDSVFRLFSNNGEQWAFAMERSSITAVDSSGWAVTRSQFLSLTSVFGDVKVPFSIFETPILLLVASYWVVSNNVFTTVVSVAPFLLTQSSTLSLSETSWISWSANNLTSAGNETCMQIQSRSFVLLSASYVSVVSNQCVSGNAAAALLRNASSLLVSGLGGSLTAQKFYHRCNTVNAVTVNATNALTVGGLPIFAAWGGDDPPCGSARCIAAFDCFAPFTAELSSCSVNSATKMPTCQCSRRPSASPSMCLPYVFAPPEVPCVLSSARLPAQDNYTSSKCTSIQLYNVSAAGSMTLTIDVAAMIQANPSTDAILVLIEQCSFSEGATLLIDSRAYKLPQAPGSSSPTVTVRISDLSSQDGSLVFAGTFPAGSEIFLKNLTLNATSAEKTPSQAFMDGPGGTSAGKMIMLVNLSLMSSSSLVLSDSAGWLRSGPRFLQVIGLYITGSLSIFNSSMLVITRTSFAVHSNSVLPGGGPPLVGFAKSTVRVENNSSLVFASVNLSAVAGVALQLLQSSFNLRHGSSINLTSVNISSSMNSSMHLLQTPIDVFMNSMWLIQSSIVATRNVSWKTSNGLVFSTSPVKVSMGSSLVFAESVFHSAVGISVYLLSSPVEVLNNSAWLIRSSVFHGTSDFPSATNNFQEALLLWESPVSARHNSGWAITGTAFLLDGISNLGTAVRQPVKLYSSRILVSNLSYFIFTSNVLDTSSSRAAPLLFSGGILISTQSWMHVAWNVFRSAGSNLCVDLSGPFEVDDRSSVAFVQNNCTAIIYVFQNISAPAGSRDVVATGSGEVFERCNTINGQPASAASLALPAQSQSAAVPCSNVTWCNATASCFLPLTVPPPLGQCRVRPGAVAAGAPTANIAAINQRTAVCQCLPGGSGDSCLPPRSVPSAPSAEIAALPCVFTNKYLEQVSDIAVNSTCSNILFMNVTLSGNWTLTVNVTAGLFAIAVDNVLTVLLRDIKLRNGATLFVDSRAVGPAPLPVRATFITLLDLQGLNGALVIAGTFPAGARINVSGINFTSARQLPAAPMHRQLFPSCMMSPPMAKFLLLADVGLSQSSFMVLSRVSLDMRQLPDSTYFPVCVCGSLSVRDSSALIMDAWNLTCGGSSAFLFTAYTAVIISESSSFKMSNFSVESQWIGLYLAGNVTVAISNASQWSLSESRFVLVNGSSSNFFLNSAMVWLYNRSGWIIRRNSFETVSNILPVLMLMNTSVSVDFLSYWLFTGNTLASASGRNGMRLDATTIVSLSGASWILWRWNTFSSIGSVSCVDFLGALALTDSVMSITGNNCSAATALVLRGGSDPTAAVTGATALLVMRCNRLNGSLSSAVGGFVLGPKVQEIDSCEACNSSTDCFPAFTASESLAYPGNCVLSEDFTISCQCSASGGSSAVLCLPTVAPALKYWPCNLYNIVLPLANKSIDPACTTIVWVNVTAQGNMLVNLSIAAIVRTNPAAPLISVQMTRFAAAINATLRIEGFSSAMPAPVTLAGRLPFLNVTIDSFSSRNGLMVFEGLFPPKTIILVQDAVLNGSSSYPPLLKGRPLFWMNNVRLSDRSSMVVRRVASDMMHALTSTLLVSGVLELTNQSALLFVDWTSRSFGSPVFLLVDCQCRLISSSSFTIQRAELFANNWRAFHFMRGELTVADASSFQLLQWTAWHCSDAVYLDGVSSMEIRNGSTMIVSFVTVFVPNQGAILFEDTYIQILQRSQLHLDHLAVNDSIFFSGSTSSILLNDQSRFIVSDNDVTSTGKVTVKVSGEIRLSNGSSWVVRNNVFTVKSGLDSLLNLIRPVSISDESWVLWTGNTFEASAAYSCINTTGGPLQIGIDSAFTFVENNCTSQTAIFSSPGSGGLQVNLTASNARLFVRCNRHNQSLAGGGSAGIPSDATSAGETCGACNSSADCYAPLIVVNSPCSINASLRATECQCAAGGQGSLCLPSTASSPLVPCTLRDIFLPLQNNSVSPDCIVIDFHGVTIKGKMTLVINVTAAALQNPSAVNFSVNIHNFAAMDGAALVIDSRGYGESSSTSSVPTVSVRITSFLGSNGALAFAGRFPPQTTIRAEDLVFTSIQDIPAPVLREYDRLAEGNQILLLADLELRNSSSMRVTNAALSGTGTTYGLRVAGQLLIADGSLLLMAQCNFSTEDLPAVDLRSITLRVTAKSSFSVQKSSLWSLRSSALCVRQTMLYLFDGSAFVVAGTELFTSGSWSSLRVYQSSFVAQSSSFFNLTNSNVTSSVHVSASFVESSLDFDSGSLFTLENAHLRAETGTGCLHFDHSDLTLNDASGWIISRCKLSLVRPTVPNTFGLAFLQSSHVLLKNRSFWLIVENNFSVRNDTFPDASVLFVEVGSAVTLQSQSWVLCEENTLSAAANDTCIIFMGILTLDPTAAFSYLNNNCTSAARMMRNTSLYDRVVISPASGSLVGAGNFYEQCNRIGGGVYPSYATGGAGMPVSAISTGNCATCNVSASCFGPLILPADAGGAACIYDELQDLGTSVCECAVGGQGNLCLPTPIAMAPQVLPCTMRHRVLRSAVSVINESCTRVLLLNVTIRGPLMVLMVNLTSMLNEAFLKSVSEILVELIDVKLLAGATLRVDARGWSPVDPSAAVVMRVDSLVGQNGALLLTGSFPPRTKLELLNVQMTADSILMPRSESSFRRFLLTFSDVVLTDYSQLNIANSSFLVENLLLSCSPLSFIGSLTVSGNTVVTVQTSSFIAFAGHAVWLVPSLGLVIANSSSLNFEDLNITSSAQNAFHGGTGTLRLTGNSTLSMLRLRARSLNGVVLFLQAGLAILQTSQWIIQTCDFASAASHVFSLVLVQTTILHDSRWEMRNSSLASTGIVGQALKLDQSPVVLGDRSRWIIADCLLLCATSNQSAVMLSALSDVALLNRSFAVLRSNIITSAHSAPVTFASSRLIVGAKSWVLIASNNFSTLGTFVVCMTFSSLSGGLEVAGSLSIVDNSCNSTRQFFDTTTDGVSNSMPISATGAGQVLLRCNRQNGMEVATADSLGFTSLPGAMLADVSLSGPCGVCNSSSDCYTPLTVPGSNCTFVPSVEGRAGADVAVCECLIGYSSGDLCLPSSDQLPTPTPSTDSPPTFHVSTHHPSSLQPSVIVSTGTAAAANTSAPTVDANTTLPTSTTSSPAVCIDSIAQKFNSSSENKTLLAALSGPPLVGTCGNTTWVNAAVPMELALECPITVMFPFLAGIVLDPPAAAVTVTTSFGRVLRAAAAMINGTLALNASISPPTVAALRSVSGTTRVTLTVGGPFASLSTCGVARRLPFAVTALWSFSFEIAPLRPMEPLRVIVSSTAAVSGAVSSFLGTPSTALQQAVLMSFSDIAGCQFSDVEALEVTSNPTGLAVGDEVGSYYRGAVVFYCCCLVAVPMLAMLVVGVLFTLMPTREYSEADIRLAGGASVTALRLHAASAKIHFPSLLLTPFSILTEGAVLSSISLLRIGSSYLDIFLASVTITSAVLMFVWAFVVTSRRYFFSCTLGDRRNEHQLSFEQHPAWRRALALTEGDREWLEPEVSSKTQRFKKRFMLFFDSYTVQWFVLVELGLCMIQSAVVGIRSNDLAACKAQSLVLLILHCGGLGAVAAMLPCIAPAENAFLLGNRIVSTATAAATVYVVFLGDASGTAVVDFMSSAGSLLSTAQTVVLLCLNIVEAARRVVKWNSKRNPATTNLPILMLPPPAPFVAEPVREELDDLEMSLIGPRAEEGSISTPLPELSAESSQPVTSGAPEDDGSDVDRLLDDLLDPHRVVLRETELVDTTQSALFMALPSDIAQHSESRKGRERSVCSTANDEAIL
jgi:hypothetical protein